ncbi:hypothetical protein ABEW34_21490 [Paenibacillus algorifonticola]|uniref:hypothetical protein n=1 Tax=Paenibacillus algorifonticola TaxID=684063 RepID=UPI003D2A0B55
MRFFYLGMVTLVFFAALIFARNDVEEAVAEKSVSSFEENFKTEYLGEDLSGWILTDTKTGCQYIAQNRDVPYIPRLNSKGVPMCNGTNE